jgi:hypothetical protein
MPKDLAEVCSLSGAVMFQPLSASLQNSLRFLRTPLPAPSPVNLAIVLPLQLASKRDDSGLPCSLSNLVWGGFCLFTGGPSSTVCELRAHTLVHLPFGVSLQVCLSQTPNHLWLATFTMFISSLLSLTRPHLSSSRPHGVRDRSAPRGYAAAAFCSEASLSPSLHTQPFPATHGWVENER